MSINFNDNDDDLFSDKQPEMADVGHEDIDALIQRAKKDITLKGFKADSFLIRTGIITSFYEVCYRFVLESNHLNRSVFDTLNKLTDNEFEKVYYADTLEESISRRFSVQSFLESFLYNEDKEWMNFAPEALGIEIDDTYLRVYFGTLHKMMAHTIDYSIDIYSKLCEQINRVPMKSIIDKDVQIEDFSLLSIDSVIAQKFSNIKSSLGFKNYRQD